MGMAGKTNYRDPPATPENAFVREALEAWNLADGTQETLADALNAWGLGAKYDKSVIGKMARSKRVRYSELVAVSQITGHPIPPDLIDPGAETGDPEIDAAAARLVEIYRSLPPGDVRDGMVRDAEMRFLAAEAIRQREADQEDPPAKAGE